MRKKASVRRTFYRSFCLLIVLPLVAVAAAGSALLYRKLLADAREMVQMRQEAVSSALTQDVRQASLQLAHFLLSEDSEGLALVDELPASSSRRYETAARLESIFDYYRLTGRRLEALHLYLTDGTSYQLYTGLAVPQNRVKEAAWYRAARQRPGEVCVGVAEPGTLLSGKNRRGDLLLTAALQVEPGYGGSALEVACLYFETDAEEMLESYNSEAGAVRMALALDGAFLAGDEALAPAVERFLGPEGVPGGGMDWGIATQVRNTGLTVVSLVDNRKLMAGYERTLWLCAGAVAAMLGSYALFSVLFLRRIVLPVQHLNEGMERLQQGDFTHKLPPEGHLEMRQLLQRYNDTGDRMQALIEENRLREEQRYAEELKALQSEINPHFLLNTVNTIRFMADLARFDSIRDMAADLMEILRCMLRTPAERYTLADEAKILEAYIHIMEVRYSGSFSFRCAFSPESLACRLPKLLLQPLVENALLHGLEGCEDGEVSLSGRTEDGVLYLSVCDNGVGMDPERLAACLSGPGEGKAGASCCNTVRLMACGWTARRAAAPVFRSRCPLGAGGKEACHAARNNRGRRDPGAGHAGKNGGLGGRGLSACGLLRQWTGRVGGYGAVSGGPCVHRYQNARLQRAGIHRRRACPGPCAPHRSAQRFR